MNIFKKLITWPVVVVIIGLIAAGFWGSLISVNPLDMALDTPNHTLRTYLKPHKILVVSFWASWCGYCMKEVNELQQLQAKHPDLTIIGLQVDDGAPNKVFKNSGYLNINASKNATNIMLKYGNYSAAVPFIVVLDEHGAKISSISGMTPTEQLEQIIYNPQKDSN